MNLWISNKYLQEEKVSKRASDRKETIDGICSLFINKQCCAQLTKVKNYDKMGIKYKAKLKQFLIIIHWSNIKLLILLVYFGNKS